jgi:hypothetical protein
MMVKINLVVRELGKLKPDYSLDFELPEVPAIGSYISIQRPDHPEPTVKTLSSGKFGGD